MSIYSYESFLMNRAEKTSSAKPTTSKFQKVGYFSLKNDGDTAIVRFAYKDKSEFQIATVHSVEVEGRYKRVVCLREPKDAVEKCPLCEAGEKLFSKFYVKLIEYTKDDNGNIVATPKVWERPSAFAETLDSLCVEYGADLCDHVFTIKRRGAKGDMKTTYDVMYKNPEVYSESAGYVKDFSAFTNFDLSKHSYYVKSFEEMSEFLETGKFPDTVKEVDAEVVKVEKAETVTEAVKQETVTEEVRPSNPYLSRTFGFTTESVTKETSIPTTPVQSDPTFSRPRRTPQSDIYR